MGSLFLDHYARFIDHYAQFIDHYARFIDQHDQSIAHYPQFIDHYARFFDQYAQLIAHTRTYNVGTNVFSTMRFTRNHAHPGMIIITKHIYYA